MTTPQQALPYPRRNEVIRAPHLRIFDGSRQLFAKPASFLVRIVDGNQRQQVWHDYRDPLAHVLLEVIPNALTHTLTDPTEVYVLRWIAGQTAGIREFAPLYTIT
jgi:hypothetical protein